MSHPPASLYHFFLVGWEFWCISIHPSISDTYMISDVGSDFGVLSTEGGGKKNSDTNSRNGDSDSNNENRICRMIDE